MNAASSGENYVTELLNLFEHQGAALFSGANSLCLTVPCLHYVQSQMTAVFGSVGGLLSDGHALKVAQPPNAESAKSRAALRTLEERLGKVIALKLIPDKHINPQVMLNLAPFRSLQVLILKKVHLKSLSNLQLLRTQLKTLVVQRCHVEILHELLVTCGIDDATPIVWSSLKELDVSMNALKGLDQCLQYVPFLEKANFSNNYMCDSLEGMEAVDKLEFLHLGFNQLKSVPRFAYRTRYHLKVFNLRNNCLERLDGVEELESLVELDLTDNMLCSFSVLRPLRALNLLQILQLAGNPITYQEYRLKAMGCLSSMINKEIFVLDGKKLTSSEQKAVPKEDIFGVVGSPSVPIPRSPQMAVTPVVPGAEPHPKPSSYPKAKRKQKKVREIQLDDDAIPQEANVPLFYERSLQHEENLRKQLQDNWLLSKMGGTMNTTPKEKKGEPPHQETDAHDDSKQVVDSGVSEVEGSSLELGETFMAELYESDSEDQGGQKTGYPRGQQSGEEEKRVLLSFTERFFTERDLLAGKQLDKMDLQSLTSAVIDRRLGRRNQLLAVLVLTFSSGRRDRRKREYILLEDDEHQKAILSLLEPIINENKGGVSITTKLECLKCCRVFDSSLAVRLQTDDAQLHPQPHLSSPYSKLKNMACPHCNSLILVEKGNTPPAARSVGGMASSPRKQSSPQHAPTHPTESTVPVQHASVTMATGSQVVNPGASIRVGFDPTPKPDVVPVHRGQAIGYASVGRSQSCPVPSPVLSRSTQSPSLNRAQTNSIGEKVSVPLGEVEPAEITTTAAPSGQTSISGSRVESEDPYLTSPSGSTPGAQAKQDGSSAEGSGQCFAPPPSSTRMSPWETAYRRQPSFQPDSPTHSGRNHNPIPEEELSRSPVDEPSGGPHPQAYKGPLPQAKHVSSPAQVRREPSPAQVKREPSPALIKREPSPAQIKREPSPAQIKREPSPAQVKREPSPAQVSSLGIQQPILNSAVAKETFQTGGGVTMTPSSSSGELPDLDVTEHASKRSTNPFDSDDDQGPQSTVPRDRPHPSEGAVPSRVPRDRPHPNEGAVPSHVPSSRQRYTVGSLSQGRRGEEHSPPSPGSHSPKMEAGGTRVMSSSLEKSPVLAAKGHSRSKSQDLRKSANRPAPSKPSSDPFGDGDNVVVPSANKRPSWTVFPSRHRQQPAPKAWHTSSDSGPGGGQKSSTVERQRQSTGDLQQSRYNVASDFVNNIGKQKNSEDRRASLQASPVSMVTSPSNHSSPPYKKEDPTYVHNSFNLYLDMEVFTTEQGENFAMIFKSRVSHYDTGQEYDALFVASNRTAYIFKITGPIRSSPEKWLQLVVKTPLKRLVYIDIGVGYQSLRLEFDLPGQCYTFLMGDEEQCDQCATKLSFVVSDVRNSSFKSLGVCPFSLESIRDPEQFLQQELKGPTASHVSCDDSLHLYLHTGLRLPGETVWSHVTLVVSTKHLFLARENYDQWPLPKLQKVPEVGSLRPPYGGVICKDITDVEKLVRQSQRTVTIHFFKENVSEGDLTDWKLHLHSHVGVDKLIAEVSSLWRDQFQMDLNVQIPSDASATPP